MITKDPSLLSFLSSIIFDLSSHYTTNKDLTSNGQTTKFWTDEWRGGGFEPFFFPCVCGS